jgi:hypothetical protein
MGCMSYSGQNPVVFEKGKGGSFIEIWDKNLNSALVLTELQFGTIFRDMGA